MPGSNTGKADQDGVTGTRRNKEQTDRHMRENKDYIHRHTNKGIRNRWSEEGKGPVRK